MPGIENLLKKILILVKRECPIAEEMRGRRVVCMTDQTNPNVPPATEAPQMERRQHLKEGQYAVQGVVMECLPNTTFKVEIQSSDVPELIGKQLLFTLVGKMRLNRIRVMPGDKVMGYVTKYDLSKGKITFRTK